jgi:hypothetical protein
MFVNVTVPQSSADCEKCVGRCISCVLVKQIFRNTRSEVFTVVTKKCADEFENLLICIQLFDIKVA